MKFRFCLKPKQITNVDINEIRKRAKKNTKFTDHSRIEMLNDRITVDEIFEVIESGEITEQYADDKPFPGCIVYGRASNRHVHIVCALPEHVDALIIITAYLPDPGKWINFKIRRK